MIAEAAKRLMNGDEGSGVVEFLRRELLESAQRGGREYSVNTLKTYVSKVKAIVLEHSYRNESCDFSELQRFQLDPEVREFLNADLKTQIQIQRRHRSASFESTWTDEMESALQDLKLLPPNMDSFRITEREVRTIKRCDKKRLRERMDKVVTVDGMALLARAIELLRAAAVSDSYPRLLAPLLLVSGRREIEILNTCSGRSSFEKVGLRSVLFHGQAKTRTEHPEAYRIPLLCEADVFLNAIEVLKAKRGDLSCRTNDEIRSMMNGFFTPMYLRQVFQMQVKWHMLRSFYLGFVFQCFEHTLAINRLGKRVLGHFDETESLRYLCARVEGVSQLHFGPLSDCMDL